MLLGLTAIFGEKFANSRGEIWRFSPRNLPSNFRRGKKNDKKSLQLFSFPGENISGSGLGLDIVFIDLLDAYEFELLELFRF